MNHALQYLKNPKEYLRIQKKYNKSIKTGKNKNLTRDEKHDQNPDEIRVKKLVKKVELEYAAYKKKINAFKKRFEQLVIKHRKLEQRFRAFSKKSNKLLKLAEKKKKKLKDLIILIKVLKRIRRDINRGLANHAKSRRRKPLRKR